MKDIELGLLASIEAQARASAFDDFLGHAKEYAKDRLKNEAGVIAGVVFEDTLRNICRNVSIKEKGKKLDNLIDELVKVGKLTQVKAKRAKVAAHVRTKATHAQWDEFELGDVETTIQFTEELIIKNIDESGQMLAWRMRF
jgi:polyhydroxyalkanoate synthesis regulator phasin